MTTAQDQQSRAADLRATIDMLDECAKAGKPWPYVPSTESIRAVLDELAAAQVLAMGRVPLTDEQIVSFAAQHFPSKQWGSAERLVRAIEAAHGITHPTGD